MSCPKGPPRNEEPRSHQGTLGQGRSLRALLYPVATAFLRRPRASPAGRDRHPGVGTLVGPAEARGPPAVDPWTKLWRPALRDSVRHHLLMPDPAAPIPPIDQPARLHALEAAVRAHTEIVPEVGIVLGSGLGGLADELEDAVAIPFEDLPGWPATTAPGHVGRLLLGRLS